MFGPGKKREATMDARLEAVELTLLAMLPVLPSQSRTIGLNGHRDLWPISLVTSREKKLRGSVADERCTGA